MGGGEGGGISIILLLIAVLIPDDFLILKLDNRNDHRSTNCLVEMLRFSGVFQLTKDSRILFILTNLYPITRNEDNRY